MKTYAVLFVLLSVSIAHATTITGFVQMDYRVQGHSRRYDAGATFTLTADRSPAVYVDNFTVRDDDFNPVWAVEDFDANFSGGTLVTDSFGNDCVLDFEMFYEGPALYLKVDGVPDIPSAIGVLQYSPALIWLPNTVPEPSALVLLIVLVVVLFLFSGGQRGYTVNPPPRLNEPRPNPPQGSGGATMGRRDL